jgi:RNA ligase
MTFALLFRRALDLTTHGRELDFFSLLNRDVSYVFELTSPYNRIIVAYDKPCVTLLTARHRITGVESLPQDVANFVNLPKRYDARNIESLVEFVNDHDPTMLEGVVFVDSKHRRLKIKSFNWCFASKTKFELSATRRNMLKLILSGKLDDIAPNLNAEIVDALKALQDKLITYARKLDCDYVELFNKAGHDRKEFALLVNSSVTWKSAMFVLYTKKAETSLKWFHQNVCSKTNKSFAEALLRELDSQPDNV